MATSGSRARSAAISAGAAVGDLGVGAGVAHQPDHAQVQHGRSALGADPFDRLDRGVVGGRPGRSRPRCVYRRPGRLRSIAATQPSGERTLMPEPLSSQTNSTGSRLAGVVEPAGGVEGGLGDGVVDRRVAEGADHDRVVRPARLRPAGLATAAGAAGSAGRCAGAAACSMA